MPSRLPQTFAYATVGLIMAGSSILFGHHRPAATFEAGHMPACDSSVVRHLLKQSIEDAPQAASETLKVLKIGTVSETTAAMDADQVKSRPDRRQCVADVFSNAGRNFVLFTIDWSDDDKDEIYLEVPELPF